MQLKKDNLDNQNDVTKKQLDKLSGNVENITDNGNDSNLEINSNHKDEEEK